MASAILVPVSEYLNTTYRPDCDYLDGELKKRDVGEQPHASVQILLGSLFHVHRQEWHCGPSPNSGCKSLQRASGFQTCALYIALIGRTRSSPSRLFFV